MGRGVMTHQDTAMVFIDQSFDEITPFQRRAVNLVNDNIAELEGVRDVDNAFF